MIYVALSLAVLLVVGAGWMRRQLVLVTVEGPSMEPAFRDGDRVLVRRVGSGRLRRGQVVVVERPDTTGGWEDMPMAPRESRHRHWAIKRIAAVAMDRCPARFVKSVGTHVPRRTILVVGDNGQESVDSRHYGAVPMDRVLGVVMGGPWRLERRE